MSRRRKLIVGLVGIGLFMLIPTMSACCGLDPVEAALVDDEIAKLGSGAQTPGPRDAEEIARVGSKVIQIQRRWKTAR